MCEDITLAAEKRHGLLFSLCADFARCLVARLGVPADGGPAIPLFSAFSCARIALVEFSYFDLDYRSEFSVTHETSFKTRAPGTARVHFFGGEPQGPPHLRDVAAASRDRYYGYVILRPQAPGTVGRSIVTPNGTAPDLKDPRGLHRHVRTAVIEHVEVFGVPLVATGVPFMEQDGALLRCAHVSAWICHYCAVLRGTVPRRTTAQFHMAEDASGSWGRYGRPYPSAGLAAATISDIMRKLDLPAEVVESDTLLRHRSTKWFDRAELVDLVGAGDPAGEDPAMDEAWIAENLTATVCRYLNSGVPCILTREDERHTQVVVGYLRHEDLAEAQDDPAGDPLHSDVVTLLVNDDQRGPYTRVPVADLVREIQESDHIAASVLVPLPRGLWLAGDVAELGGAELIAQAAAKRRAMCSERAGGDAPDAAASLLDEVYAGTRPGAGTLAVRSYATTGSDFKQGFANRVDDAAAVRVVGLTSLPKYVWVVEAIDRQRRQDRQPAVVSAVVLDASQVAGDLPALPLLAPLLIQLPGQIYSAAHNAGGRDPYDDLHWVPTGVGAYESGRWHHAQEWLVSPERVASRAKTAVTSV